MTKRKKEAAKKRLPVVVEAATTPTELGGRPTKYDPKYCQAILDFCDPERALAVMSVNKDGTPTLAQFPFMAGFAWKIGVSRDTLHEWRKQHPEFSDAYARAREAQEVILASGALRGGYNATFATLTAKNILGWRDKLDTEHSTKPDDPIAKLMADIATSPSSRLKPAGA